MGVAIYGMVGICRSRRDNCRKLSQICAVRGMQTKYFITSLCKCEWLSPLRRRSAGGGAQRKTDQRDICALKAQVDIGTQLDTLAAGKPHWNYARSCPSSIIAVMPIICFWPLDLRPSNLHPFRPLMPASQPLIVGQAEGIRPVPVARSKQHR